MTEDEGLKLCNETELLSMARNQGLGSLRRGLPKEVLVRIVTGETNPLPEHYSGTHFTRQKLEQYIEKNFAKVMSQLPGCNGKCTRFPCTEGRHALCFMPMSTTVM